MNNIIVSGATSMLGVATIQAYLEHNANLIYAIVRPNTSDLNRIPRDRRICIIECDINCYEKLPKYITNECECFYHFAWTNTGNRNEDIYAQSQNISFTLEAIRVAHSLGCTHFIGAGSQAEYGILNVNKISSKMSCNPIEPYGIAKYAAGRLAMEQTKQFGMICSWVRVFSVYGENDRAGTMIMSVLRKLLNGEHVSATLGYQRWDYLYSQDAGLAFYLVGTKAQQSDIYCLGSGRACMLREYFEIMKQITEVNGDVGYGEIPYKEGQVMNICADTKELESLGWHPQVEFAEGIRKIVASLKYYGA